MDFRHDAKGDDSMGGSHSSQQASTSDPAVSGALRAQLLTLMQRPALWAALALGGYLLYRRFFQRRRGNGGGTGGRGQARAKKEPFDNHTLMANDMRRSKAVQEMQVQYEQQAREHKEKQERDRLRKLEEAAQQKADAIAAATATPAAATQEEKLRTPPTIAAPAAPPTPQGLRRGGCS